MGKSVTAILVAYNSESVIARAIAPLARAPEVADIIVVDNCSSDNTIELVEKECPAAEIIENMKNVGFGRANNQALQKVTTPYALLVNPDAVLEDGAVAALLEAAKNYPDAAILAPRLYDEKGELHHTHKRHVFAREKNRDTYVAPEGDCCAEFLSGAVWLVDMAALKKIGFFDPKIFLYYEDDDMCLRARAAGFGPVLVHEARGVHLLGKSSGEDKPASVFFKQAQMVWSRLYIEGKYHGHAAAATLLLKLRFAYAFKAAFYLLRFQVKKTNRYRGRLAGIFAFSEGKTPDQIG